MTDVCSWTLSDTIQVVTAGVLLVTFIAILAYTVETHKLRVHTERELEVLRDQARTSLLPAIIFGLKTWNREGILAHLDLSLDSQSAETQARVARVQQSARHFVCPVSREGDRIAHGFQAVLFDKARGQYFLSDQGADILPKDVEMTLTFTGEGITFDGFVTNHRRVYASAGEFMIEPLRPRTDSFIAIMFADLSDRLYLRMREFVVTEAGTVGLRRAALFYEPGEAS